MSAYSTLRITRSAARRKLDEYFRLEISNKTLEDFLDRILEPRLYNAIIVSDDERENDDHLLSI